MSWDVGAWVANTLKKLITTKTSELNTTITSGKVPIVRRVQRGTYSVDWKQATGSITLSGFTNTSKMSVKLYGARNSGGHNDIGKVTGLTATTLTVEFALISTSSNGSSTHSYEVIEYW